jgi:Flp pilus assembly protein TadG
MTFFLLAFAIIDFSWLMFSQMNEQDAVREAGRFASTGNTNGTYTRVQSITQVLDAAAVQGNINHCTVVISSAAGGTGSAGGPGDTVTVTATCHIPMLTTGLKWFPGNHDYNFTTSSTFVNEPFPGTGS